MLKNHLLPYHSSRVNLTDTSFVRSIRRFQNATQRDPSEDPSVRFFHISNKLSDVAVQGDVVLNFELLSRIDEARDQDLEDAAHDLTFDASQAVQRGSVRCSSCRGVGRG